MKQRYVTLPAEPDDTVHLEPGVDFRGGKEKYSGSVELFCRAVFARILAATDAKE